MRFWKPTVGRRPQPAKIHRLRGNPSKLSEDELERREREEVKPHPIAPRRPADLSPLERECWDMHAAELDRLGLFTVLDGASFRLLVCMPYAAARAAWLSMMPAKADGSPDRRRKSIEVVTPDRTHAGALRRHPGFLSWAKAIEEYRAGCRDFGLTPQARVGLRAGAPIGSVPDDDDSDEAFFGT